VIAPRSLRETFQAYLTAKVDEWADNTLRLRRWRWSKFELYAGRDMLARDVTRETLDGFKRAMLATHAPNQVRQAIKEVTGVFRWAVDRDLIPPTKVTNYSTGFKKAILRTGPKMAEYSRDERDRIIAALDPRDRGQWRAWALNVLFSYCGPRQSAARHLEIADIELEEPSFLTNWRQHSPKRSSAAGSTGARRRTRPARTGGSRCRTRSLRPSGSRWDGASSTSTPGASSSTASSAGRVARRSGAIRGARRTRSRSRRRDR
jgi:hypothetical protein